jgi:hypothetical protein
MRAFRSALSADELGVPVMNPSQGKYDYQLAGYFGREYKEIDKSLVNQEFADIARSFIRSIDRIAFLYELPVQLIYWSTHLSRVRMTTRHRLGIDPNDPSKDGSPEFLENAQAVYKQLRGSNDAIFDFGANVISSMLDGKQPVLAAGEGVEAAFAAMAMNAYATLETLAADLWIAAVNRDHKLAVNWQEKNSEKQVLVSVLAGYGFDVSSNMGTVLHETRRVSFESWGEVKKAYTHAFKGELDDAFEPQRPIYLAEKTRHLFAHRGGMVDRKFRDEMKGFPEYSSLVVGERLRLTGPVVRDHVDACVKCGVALLQSVDTWAASRP